MMADEQPPDVTPPDLTENWHLFGPPMSGTPRGTPPGASTGTASAPPPVRAYEVSPGSLEAASEAILRATHAAVGAYDDVKNYVNTNKGWVFDVANPTVLTNTQYVPYQDTAYPVPPWDPHADWTQQWTVQSDNLLLAVANTITLAGQFLDAVNNAGQFYTKADHESEMPQIDVNQSAT
jgi:hypothetical protein